jgi:hypothetical protein
LLFNDKSIVLRVLQGTKFLTKQLATGVVMAENLIGQVSKNVHEKIVPNPEPTKIGKGIHVTARGLRSTSVVAVKASGYVGKTINVDLNIVNRVSNRLHSLVSKVGAMTLGLARIFAPNFGKIEKRVKPDGTVEVVKLSGIRSIGHAGLISKFFMSIIFLENDISYVLFSRLWCDL